MKSAGSDSSPLRAAYCPGGGAPLCRWPKLAARPSSATVFSLGKKKRTHAFPRTRSRCSPTHTDYARMPRVLARGRLDVDEAEILGLQYPRLPDG